MNPAFHHTKNFQSSAFRDSELILQKNAENFWDDLAGDQKNEKQFNSFKYVLLTGIVVLLIAITVFISNRNQVSEQKPVETSQLISFFKK